MNCQNLPSCKATNGLPDWSVARSVENDGLVALGIEPPELKGADSPKPKPAEKEAFYASVHPGPGTPLPEKYHSFAKAVLDYEKASGIPAWVVIQSEGGNDELDSISDDLLEALVKNQSDLDPDKRLSLILHTLGGNPHAGYKIATFLQKTTSGVDVVIPKMAKSAGTLIALSAAKIIMCKMAELGPLDMQVRDSESDLWDSALNETKSLQTLSREALLLYTEKMELLKKLYGRKTFDTKNRIATEFVNEMIRPLVEKIDAVHYTKMARIMDIMKMYGRQLMKRAGYPISRISKVVDSLGDDFPDHSYIIDCTEACDLGLRAESPRPDLAPYVKRMGEICGQITIIGKVTTNLPS